jgi:hypothetical protein
MILLFQFLIGHAFGDFVLQGEVMARAKNRNYAASAERGPGFPPWYYWLGAHALVHGGIVFAISGSVWLGLIETGLHAAIDFAKCEHRITFHQDQALHLICKVGYCVWLAGAGGLLAA